MKILHVVRQFPPGIGGLENYVANLAREQGRLGHFVTVLTLNRLFSKVEDVLPSLEQGPGYNIVRISFFGSKRYPLAPGFFKHLRDADVVHIHAMDFFADAAAATSRWHGKPLVITTHGGIFHTRDLLWLKHLFFNTVTRLSTRAYSSVIASSINDLKLFRPICEDKLVLVENGVDLEKFAECGSRDFRKKMIYIGRFSKNKRLDRLLDFFREVYRRDSEWRLTIAGVPSDLDEGSLRALITMRELNGCTDILLNQSDEDLRQVLGHCSVFASASQYEGFGLTVVECVSAGLWPVLNDIPAFERMNTDMQVGIVGDFTHPGDLAHRFLQQARMLEQDYGAIRASTIQAAKRYAWPDVAKRIDGIYDQVIAAFRARPATLPLLPQRPSVPARQLASLDAVVVEPAESPAQPL